MAEFINTVDILGDEYVTGAIIDRSITEYRDNLVTWIGPSAFYKCSNLTTVDLAAVVTFDANAFNYCTNLNTVILRNETEMCILRNVQAFSNTGIINKTGYIYVPSALIDSYRSKWTSYTSQFRAIEDYPEICG